MQDNYLDAYVNVLRTADPEKTSLVFNCGMGVVRSEASVTSKPDRADYSYVWDDCCAAFATEAVLAEGSRGSFPACGWRIWLPNGV